MKKHQSVANPHPGVSVVVQELHARTTPLPSAVVHTVQARKRQEEQGMFSPMDECFTFAGTKRRHHCLGARHSPVLEASASPPR